MSKRLNQDTAAKVDPTKQFGTKRRRTIQRHLRENYTYTPLADPEKQIRLLHFLQDQNEQCMSLEMSTWDIGSTPDYVAISYTWGARRYKDVRVDGKAVRIRENSHYALSQIRLHHADMYVWMDSICIAQSEKEEKGHQVKIMGSIFESAQKVVACVGEHGDGSELVMETARNASMSRGSHSDLDVQSWQDSQQLAKVYEKLRAFLIRPYFRRLWIVQEVAAASGGRLDFMCGSSVISKDEFDHLFDSCKDSDGLTYYGELNYEAMRDHKLRELTLNQAFLPFWHRECHDPRDRLYAVLSLIKWDARGPLISPDYSITPIDLALKMCQYCDLYSMHTLLIALRISASEPTFQTWLHERTGNCRPSTDCFLTTKRRTLTYMATCVRLRIDDNGAVTAPFRKSPSYHDGFTDRYLQNGNPLELLAQSAKPVVKYRHIHNALEVSELCALICDTAVTNDILLPLSGAEDRLLPLLVLRKGSDDTFDVVGQCIYLKGYLPLTLHQEPPGEGKPVDSSSESRRIDQDVLRARVRLTLSYEDYIVLAGEYGMGEEEADDYAPESWFRRLAINPLLFPKAAVTMTPIGEGDICSNQLDYEYEE